MKKKLTLQDKAICAINEAVHGVVERHKQNGQPLSVWKNGKVVQVLPQTIK
jgi:hypothetical protein